MSFLAPRGAFDPEEILDPNRDLAEADVGFTGPDIETDQQVIATQVFDDLARRVTGWEAHDGNPDTWLVESFAEVAAEVRALARDVPNAIFATFGSEVLGLPRRIPAPALGVTRWTAQDDRGYSVRPGLQITIDRAGDDRVGFEVLRGGVIEPGEVMIDNVEVVAVIEGADANGLQGLCEVSDPIDWVQAVEITRPTVDGDDGQTVEDYLDTLSNLLRIIAFRPVLPWDFALLALQVPGVGRAVAMDGFEPSDGTWGHQRQVALVVTDRLGERLPAGVKDTIRTSLEQAREINFRVPILDPLYDPVDVEFAVTAFVEQDPDVVLDICTDAIRQELEPGNFRLGTTSPGTAAGEVIPPPVGGAQPGRQTIWVNNLIGLLDRCRGVDRVDWVTINGETEDYELSGPTTLPRPGEIEGEVNTQ